MQAFQIVIVSQTLFHIHKPVIFLIHRTPHYIHQNIKKYLNCRGKKSLFISLIFSRNYFNNIKNHRTKFSLTIIFNSNGRKIFKKVIYKVIQNSVGKMKGQRLAF